jgi:uncharacterized protein (DUF885 family)
MKRLACVFALLAVACGGSSASDRSPPAPTTTVAEPAPPAAEPARNEELNAFFEEVFQRDLARSPMRQTYLGVKSEAWAEWDDISDERAREDHELARADLERLRTFDPASLDAEDRLSYRLFEYDTERDLAGFEWRFHSYPVNQMFGLHSWVPAFLMNFHRIDTREDAEAYISRLEKLKDLFAQLEVNLRARQDKGILPPKFVFPMVIDDSKNIITGAPFDKSGTDSDLYADIKRKVEALDLDEAARAELLARARKALLESVKPAYQSLIALLEQQAKLATTDDGAWKLPDGPAFYDFALQRTTTTELDAAEIHAIGLRETERIHDEMSAIMKKVGFEGTLQEFFAHMRTNPDFILSNDDAGRAAYLKMAEDYVAGITPRLDELFITMPKAPLVVKRVEPYREKSAGKAFYNGPTPDGSRPGIFYANLHDMADMPTYQLEALVYHEGLPGHHMQTAIAYEQENLPSFRRFSGYTAYNEGWGLYSELVPKEMGFYRDPYSDFGRLAMELWRAGRLVVDTGIHHQKWTRQQAIDWLIANTPNPEGDAIKAIERYIVMPSQATAYKIGMLKILELRERARAALGDRFDIRAFHEVVLTSGAVPLTVLEEQVEAWLDRERTKAPR